MRRLVGFLSVGAVSAVTPVQKVIQMLTDMAAQGKKEKHEESVAFSAFNQWCGDVSAEKKNNIEQASAAIEQNTAKIAKAEADAAALGRSIAALEAQIGQFNQEHSDAKAIRDKEHSDFLAQQTDYEESIDALGRAKQILKQQNFDRKQAEAALIQVSNLAQISSKHKKQILSLLQISKDDPDFLSRSAPEANAYEFQSGGVIAMFETLESKFVEELRGVQKEESNTKHQFTLLSQSLQDQIGAAEKQRDSEVEQRAGKLEVAGKAKGDLADAEASFAADTKYLKDLTAECDIKSKEFENRQTLRGEEINALNQAVEILGGKAVTGNADTYLPKLVQIKKTSFLQLSATRGEDKHEKLVEFLQNRASKMNGSKVLSLLVARLNASPFAKVTKMIEGLIMKLKEEANAEAEEHGWCTTELATNKQTRDDKTKASDELRATVEALQAEIADQTLKMEELTQAVQESDAAVREASAQRLQESAKNKQTVRDAKAAQEAVTSALTVLKEFYNKAGQATSLLSTAGAADDAPGTWDASYKGMQGESGGVLGMIEVIQSDFVRLETETSAEEAESSRNHQQFLDDSAEDKAVKEAEHQHLSQRRTRNESNLNSAKRDLAAVSEELAAANDYFETALKERCGLGGSENNYAERKARREEEIESLKEALTIFESH